MLLTAKHLITGDGRTVLSNAALLVEDGRIADLGLVKELQARYPNQPLEDLGDATLLPGLIDMHVHLGYYYSQPDAESYDGYLIACHALAQGHGALKTGVTTVRDLSSPPGLMRQLKKAAEKSYAPLPRLFHSGPGICMSGGHGHEDGVEEADGPWAVRSAIRRQRRDGADWIKILTSGREDIPEYTQEELDAAADECRRRNIPSAVHAGLQPAIEMCIRSGFDTIEHGTFLTAGQAALMKEKGIAWVPTMVAYTYLYERTRETAFGHPGNSVSARAARDRIFFEKAYLSYKENFRKLYDTGVTVLAGSDMVLLGAPVTPIPRELELMVEYGITPVQAVATATSEPARVLGISDEAGTLKKGLAADILAVRGNAAEDIGALTSVIKVWLNGCVVHQGPDEKQPFNKEEL